jgi:Ca2+-binding RTX toxin-like protein
VSGRGTDLMWGDAAVVDPGATTGADTFVFGRHSGNDTIFDFRESDGDRIDVSGRGIRSLADMTLSDTADGALIVFEPSDAKLHGLVSHLAGFGAADSVTLVGVQAETLQASDFIFANHA